MCWIKVLIIFHETVLHVGAVGQNNLYTVKSEKSESVFVVSQTCWQITASRLPA